MATSVTALAVVEALQYSFTEQVYVGYLPNIASQFRTGLKLGDTAKVPLIKAGSPTDFNASTNNYAGSGSVGSATGIDIVLNKQKLVTFEIPANLRERVQMQRVVDSSVRQIMSTISGDIFGLAIAATYTNTAIVTGLASAFGMKQYNGLKDEIVAKSLNPMMTTVAMQSAYISNVESETSVLQDAAYRAAITGNNQTSALISRLGGMATVRTSQIPVGTNVVGAIFDDTSMGIAFGNNAPSANDPNIAFYQEVVDPSTGFTLAVSETYDVATRKMVIGVEAVYGVKAADITKLTLLKSA